MNNKLNQKKRKVPGSERGTSIVEYVILLMIFVVMAATAVPNLTGTAGVSDDPSNGPSETPTGVAGVYGTLGFELFGVDPMGNENGAPLDPSGCTIGGVTPSGLCGVKP